MYQRLFKPLLTNSFFLFGARGTGKSTFLRALFSSIEHHWIDLLDDSLCQEYLLDPSRFESEVLAIIKTKGQHFWIVVDEIQKAPALLNYVHRLIESHRIKFALTGSSARKLKRGGANLLAGRAFLNEMFPLSALEMGDSFHLEQVMHWGAMPSVWSQFLSEEERHSYLQSYVANYIRQEILEEQMVRKIEPFLHFLPVAAQANGKILNYSNIAKDAGTDSKTVERYYQILEDTLLGHLLPPYHRSIRKRQTQKSKFYFFDLGVKRALERMLKVPLIPSTGAYGYAFEHFIILECLRLNKYLRKDFQFSYLMTKDGVEIDLIIERPAQTTLLVEIKSSKKVDPSKFKAALKIKQEILNAEFIVCCQESYAYQENDISVFSWQQAIKYIFE